MANVLLLNPPLSEFELYRRGAAVSQSKVEPLGLAYIAAMLEEAGHKVRVIDGIVEEKSLRQIVAVSQHFDFVGISGYTSFIKRCFETAKTIKEATDVPIIFGGPHVTAVPLEVIEKDFVDFVVLGEGEYATRDLVNALERGKSAESVRGLYFKRGKMPCFTGERPFIKNLDELPFPARHLLPMHLYVGSDTRSKRKPSHCLITSRGCPANCSFCHKRVFGREFRVHSPERVLEEMRLLVERYKAKDISIWDDNFTVDKGRVIKICELVKEQGWDLTFNCEARVDGVDLPVLNALKEAGCRLIAYGVESGSQRVLNLIRKGFTKDRVRETFKYTKEAGIDLRGYFMLGLPSETRQEILETIEFAKELDPTIATFALFTPLPETDAYAQAVKSGELKKPFYWREEIVPDFNFLEEPICLPTGIKAGELIKLHRKAYRNFYLRPGYLLRRLLSIRGGEDIKIMVKGFFTIINA